MNRLPADPTVLHPFADRPRVVLLKPLLTSPLIEAGEYSYYDDPEDPTAFETRKRPLPLRAGEAGHREVLRAGLAWRDWPAAHLTEHIRAVMSGTVDDLERAVPRA